ncbi:MAG: tripartite tricarboxylate transporter TctB family protein [Alphaproteobacteria bacterium]|nr:tripartite tricarboxylate transporter TctB family protein [Alphaproteobacteria bacterium]
MSHESPSGKPDKKHIGGELIIPVAGVVFAIYYFSTIIDSPFEAQVSAFFVGTILMALVAVFILKSAISVIRGEADLSMEILLSARSFLPKRLALFALTVAFIIVVEWGGFTLTTFAFLALAMLLLSNGRNLKFVLILAASLAIGGYLLFIVAFHTRFPFGPFEHLMNRVL